MKNEIPDNYVALGQHVCVVCGTTFNSGEVLINKRLKGIPEDKRITGISICPTHQKQVDEGFIHLVGVDPTKSEKNADGTLRFDKAHRTGNIVAMRREVWSVMITGYDLPDQPFVYIDDEAIHLLKKRYESLVAASQKETE